MRINWFGYYDESDGYGRFNARVFGALQQMGVDAKAYHCGVLEMPEWMLAQQGIDWSRLSISCLPPYMLKRVPGRHWLYTMTEGSALPLGWADTINESGVERVVVPCQANAETFRDGGVAVPVSVINGGTDPDEFPIIARNTKHKPYTFLTLADRASRKGWFETWSAFYKAFGPTPDGKPLNPNVRLIVKCLPNGNDAVASLAGADNRDPRIEFQMDEFVSPQAMYAQADCVVLPSRYEGFGMGHREAAMMGVPVITQCHSGLDDGHTREWATVVVSGKAVPIPVEENEAIQGHWYKADVEDLARAMEWCYAQPELAIEKGQQAAKWLRENQTWRHTSVALLEAFEDFGAMGVRVPSPLAELVTGG